MKKNIIIAIAAVFLFVCFSGQLTAQSFFRNDVIYLHGIYHHPLDEIATIMDRGGGGVIGYTMRDLFIMNLNLGIEGRYIMLQGKPERIDKLTFMPLYLTAGYRLHLYGDISVEPRIGAGYGYTIISYADNDLMFIEKGYSEHRGFDATGFLGCMLHYNLNDYCIVQAGADYTAILESDNILDGLSFSLGIGMRIGDGYPIEMLNDRENITIQRGRDSLIITIVDVSFKFNSVELTEHMIQEFDRVSEILKRYRSHRITLIGHSDNIGEPDVRQSISLQKAEMTKKYLVEEKSFNADLMKCEGMGSRNPIADNATEEGRARNRRVDVVVHAQ